MTAPAIARIIATLAIIAIVIWLALALDAWRFRRYRARRDEHANAAWRPAPTEKDRK
jgi:hypothetical protein